MSRTSLVCLVVATLAAPAVRPSVALAQMVAPEPSKARLRLGPVYLNPGISLVNAGMDNNVFNEPEQRSPKRDFTATVQPRADLWVRMGRSWVIGAVSEDLVFYRRYSSERSANLNTKLGVLVPLNRVAFSANGTYLDTRDRPGFEIDARSQRTEKGGDAKVEVRTLPKTFFGARLARTATNFDSVATFEGISLRDALNRTVTSGAFTVRHQLTPLTGLTLDIGREASRFSFSPLRDADSTRVAAGVTFDQFALVKGSATVGYRAFSPQAGVVPSFTGTTAQADLTYTALGNTKVNLVALRDVQYSFEVNEPYYLQSGATVSVSQRIAGPVDGVARMGLQRLSYRTRADAVAAFANRVDHVRIVGGGLGYRLGRTARIGINVDSYRRTSPVSFREFDALRIGTSVTYGN